MSSIELMKELMKEAGLGTLFRKMTVSALRKAIRNAQEKGETSIQRGSAIAPLVTMEEILAKVGNAAVGTASEDDVTPTTEPSKMSSTKRKPISAAQKKPPKKRKVYSPANSKHVAASEQGEYSDVAEFEESRKRISNAKSQAKKKRRVGRPKNYARRRPRKRSNKRLHERRRQKGPKMLARLLESR